MSNGFEDFANFVIPLATVGAVLVTWTGLQSWKSQKLWDIDHELARRILVNLFKYRDVVAGVRHPAMFASEIPVPPEDKAVGMSDRQKRFYGTQVAYFNRFDKVTKIRELLYADSIESEAAWGAYFKNKFRELHALEVELASQIRAYLTTINPDEDDETRKAYSEIYRKKRDIMYSDLTGSDAFDTQFDDILKELEKFLGSKLGRKS